LAGVLLGLETVQGFDSALTVKASLFGKFKRRRYMVQDDETIHNQDDQGGETIHASTSGEVAARQERMRQFANLCIDMFQQSMPHISALSARMVS
jgi:hypothetical protein